MSDELVDALMAASRALVGIAASSVGDEPLVTLVQYRALVVVAGSEGCMVSDLAVALEVHPTSATRLVDRLVSKELLSREEGEHDRRTALLRLTRRGAAIVSRVQARRREAIAAVVSTVGPAPSRVAAEALRAFAQAAGEPDHLDLFGWSPSQ